MQQLSATLARLASIDTKHRVFGARLHRYALAPVRPDALAALEALLNVALPPAYRDLLLTVGSGAGPYYGMWSPSQVRDEWVALRDDYEQDTGILVDAARPFPFTRADAQGDAGADRGAVSTLSGTWPCDGCIPIAHQGCASWSVLVTSGEVTGTVWEVANFVGADGDFAPAGRPPGIVELHFLPKRLAPLPLPPPLEEWYAGWLARALADLDGRS